MESGRNNTLEEVNSKCGKISSLEKSIAKLYIFFLPIRLFSQLDFLKSILNVAANYMAIVFHIFGLLAWLLNENFTFRLNNKKNGELFKDLHG